MIVLINYHLSVTTTTSFRVLILTILSLNRLWLIIGINSLLDYLFPFSSDFLVRDLRDALLDSCNQKIFIFSLGYFEGLLDHVVTILISNGIYIRND
jgi:hypothetical protein